jgi:hypothetical protein
MIRIYSNKTLNYIKLNTEVFILKRFSEVSNSRCYIKPGATSHAWETPVAPSVISIIPGKNSWTGP